MRESLAITLVILTGSVIRAAEPVSPDFYVGGWQVNHEFDKVTDQCVETLRKKKVLLYGMSFALSTVDGLATVGREDKKHALNTVKKDKDVTPADFTAPVFLRTGGAERYPYTLRVEAMDKAIRSGGYDKVLDGALVVWHHMTGYALEEGKKGELAGVRKVYEIYSSTWDRLRKDYPNIKMIYCMPGILPTKEANQGARQQHYGNVASVLFNSMVSDNYLGEVPIYDMESFLSTDVKDKQMLVPVDLTKHTDFQLAIWFRGTDVPRRFEIPAMCEDYVAGDRLHGWNKAGSPRFGRAMLLTMAKAWCPEAFPKRQYAQKTLQKYPNTILKMNFDGQIQDGSGNNLLAALSKGRSGLPQPCDGNAVFVSGVRGEGLSLSKLQDVYPVVGDHEILNGMERLHVSIHARRFKGYGWGALLHKQDQFEMRLFDGEVRGFLRTVKEQVAFRGKAPQDDKWHRYELDYDGRRLAVLVDGEKVFEQALTGAVHSTPHPLFIGKKGPFGYTFDGDVDELEAK